MADFDPRHGVAQGRAGTGVGAQVDEGLRSFMLGVYNYMALGVAFTAVISMLLMMNPEVMRAIALGPMKWALFIGVLGLGWFSPRLILTGNRALAHGTFWLYAALWGALISPMVYAFLASGQSNLVFRALAITAVTFGATSLYGYVTKRDLSGFGTFFVMATIGLIVAMVVNFIFFQSGMMSFIISSLVVIVFAGITAYETQMIKEMYVSGDEGLQGSGKSIFGAFMLYGSFITLFIHILNILGFLSSD